MNDIINNATALIICIYALVLTTCVDKEINNAELYVSCNALLDIVCLASVIVINPCLVIRIIAISICIINIATITSKITEK